MYSMKADGEGMDEKDGGGENNGKEWNSHFKTTAV